MVVFYSKEGGNTRDITMVEHDVMAPTIPADMNLEQQIAYYSSIGTTFIALPYELGGKIFDYKVCINENEEFIALQPKEG